jgi:signal transduction histidine kinase
MTESRVDRRDLLAAEVAVLVVALLIDLVSMVLSQPGNAVANLAPVAGEAIGVLAVLRRWFAGRLAMLAYGVMALSLVSTAVSFLVGGLPQRTCVTELVGLALVIGAGCRGLGRRQAAILAIVGAVALMGAPLSRYELLLVPAALLWGGAVAVGLILRDADHRRATALAEVRTGERLQLARELHDLVAHHVTGIVVRAQAAKLVAAGDTDAFEDIELAGAEALAAMRRLVGMLRTTEEDPPELPSGVAEVVQLAAATYDNVEVVVESDEVTLLPEVGATVHRVVGEALTNVRRHAPEATFVRVAVRVEDSELVVDVLNDGVIGRRRPGYGLIGMAERLGALGGRLHARAEDDQRWRVTAWLPLPTGPEVTR